MSKLIGYSLVGCVFVFGFYLKVTAGNLFPFNTDEEEEARQEIISLFNGKDLSGWYTYLEGRGRDSDPKGVFTVSDGIIRISGEEWGSLTTGKEYANYHLTLEFKWGE
ncbi:DUF1080 domain-containing protein, partial [Mariniphaga sediminis]